MIGWAATAAFLLLGSMMCGCGVVLVGAAALWFETFSWRDRVQLAAAGLVAVVMGFCFALIPAGVWG